MSENGARPKYLEIKEKIRQDTDKMPAHTRIPSRPIMMKKYGVTRTTVEKAISELAGEGYLYSKNGSGTYIAEHIHETDSTAPVASWGVIIPNIMFDVYPEILRGVEDVAQRNHINVIICNTDHDSRKQAMYIKKLTKSEVKGIIAVPAVTNDSSYSIFKSISDKGIPLVFCSRGVEGIKVPKVVSNNFYGSYLATKHLAENGYMRIAFASRPKYSSTMERYQGYMAAMQECGLEIRPQEVFFQPDMEFGDATFNFGLDVLSRPDRPEAFVCSNDMIAQNIYRAVEQTGLQVGLDVGITGYDDSHISEAMPVKITSVRYPKHETGYRAAELILRIQCGERIDDSHVEILPPQLIIKQSSIRLKV